MKFAYRKFGEFYYVSELHSYNNVTKEYKLSSIGTVRKLDKNLDRQSQQRQNSKSKYKRKSFNCND